MLKIKVFENSGMFNQRFSCGNPGAAHPHLDSVSSGPRINWVWDPCIKGTWSNNLKIFTSSLICAFHQSIDDAVEEPLVFLTLYIIPPNMLSVFFNKLFYQFVSWLRSVDYHAAATNINSIHICHPHHLWKFWESRCGSGKIFQVMFHCKKKKKDIYIFLFYELVMDMCEPEFYWMNAMLTWSFIFSRERWLYATSKRTNKTCSSDILLWKP